MKKLALKIVSYILFFGSISWIYAPIIAGIIIPMVYMLPIAFTSRWLFAPGGSSSWVDGWIIMRITTGVIVFFIFEVLLFIVGLVLFIWGVIVIVKKRVKQEGLATDGPYKYIRHPQHLGLSIMTFATSLYIPWTSDLGIRLGEILSWSIFTLILFIVSDFEERKLVKKYGEEYTEYRKKTGSFLPRFLNKEKERKSFQEIKYWKRYSFTSFGYISFIVLMYVLSLPVFGIFSYTL